MAGLTVTNKYAFNLLPGLRLAFYSITFDSAYIGTDGEVADLSNEFPNEVFGASICDDTRRVFANYHRATSGACSTGTIKIFQGRTNAGFCRAATTNANLASINFYMVAWGK